jgi:ribosomal-protein-serine acetyltransferase
MQVTHTSEPAFHLEVDSTLVLRQFDETDAPGVFALVERNRARLREWLPWVDRTGSAVDLTQFIRRAQAQYESGQGPQCVILWNGALAGSLGCHPIDWANRSCAIGYWLDSVCEGNGVVTRCATALLDYLFETIALHRVEIRCGTGNSRSCAVPKRLGFAREGVLREAERLNSRWVDLAVWAMLNRDWRAIRSAARRQ